jgi:hypothetical protein
MCTCQTETIAVQGSGKGDCSCKGDESGSVDR